MVRCKSNEWKREDKKYIIYIREGSRTIGGVRATPLLYAATRIELPRTMESPRVAANQKVVCIVAQPRITGGMYGYY